MNTHQNVIDKIASAIGGEWQSTGTDAPVQGYQAHFPQFKANAVVGVINAAAEQAGARERAFSSGLGAVSAMLGDDPQAPRGVVIPKALAENRGFQAQLTEEMQQTVSGVISAQLAHRATQGLHGR
jgi:hypothetical protein